jgi:signal transduction histidine kinase
MKFPRIGLVLFVFLIIGIAIFLQILVGQEEKSNIDDIINKGNHIVSLIALHPLQYFEGERSDFFLRTLSEYTAYQGLVYCFISDQTGQTLVSLVPSNLASKIPLEVQTWSLASTGLTHQFYKTDGSANSIYEFAKPIFENGEKTGTVRIGLKLSSIAIFTMERVSLLAMLLFFVISALIIGYYGITRALRPLEKMKKDILSSNRGLEAVEDIPLKGVGIAPFIEDFQRSLAQLNERLEKIKTANTEMASKLGVLTFEKNQILHIFNSINFGIIITDTQDNVGHVNKYVCNLLNRTLEDVVDHPFSEILQHDEINSFVSHQDAPEQTRNISHIDTTFPEFAPGEVFRVSFSYLLDNEKSPIGKMILFNNITREISAKKATEEFTSHLAHELMTPLTTIRSYSEMLMEGEIDDGDTQREFYNTINGETNRLTDLIKGLLNIAKIEMGCLTLNKGLVRSDWLLEDCIAAVEGAAQKKNIAIERVVPDNFPSLIGDKDQLKASIINILGNAVKYTPENGNVQFSVNENQNMVIFEVIDTGYGISQEDLSHIFDKFYRSENPQISEQQGTGLGLAITSEIIRLHDGKIEVQSEIGKGTHFAVKIPKEEYYLENQ